MQSTRSEDEDQKTVSKQEESIETTKALGNLLLTCKSTYSNRLFRDVIDNRLPLLALNSVVQGNLKRAISLAKYYAYVFFMKSTTSDYAKDLEGNQRILEDWSPYQAIFGTGDFGMLMAVKPYLDAFLATSPNFHKLAKIQEQEKFPNGFDYPESTYDFSFLMEMIGADQQLANTGKPNDVTLAVEAAFKADFKPGIIKRGHHFNMNDFVKVYAIYRDNRDPHNERRMVLLNIEQEKFFCERVIGFLERLLPAPYMQLFCNGSPLLREKKIECLSLFKRDYKVMNSIPYSDEHEEIIIYPLDTQPHFVLGKNCLINIYYGEITKHLNAYHLSLADCKYLESCVNYTEERLYDLAISSQTNTAASQLEKTREPLHKSTQEDISEPEKKHKSSMRMRCSIS